MLLEEPLNVHEPQHAAVLSQQVRPSSCLETECAITEDIQLFLPVLAAGDSGFKPEGNEH